MNLRYFFIKINNQLGEGDVCVDDTSICCELRNSSKYVGWSSQTWFSIFVVLLPVPFLHIPTKFPESVIIHVSSKKMVRCTVFAVFRFLPRRNECANFTWGQEGCWFQPLYYTKNLDYYSISICSWSKSTYPSDGRPVVHSFTFRLSLRHNFRCYTVWKI